MSNREGLVRGSSERPPDDAAAPRDGEVSASQTERIRIRRFIAGEVTSVDDDVVAERDVAIAIAGEMLVRATCSPGELGEWVLGYLYSEGLISTPESVREIRGDEGTFTVRLTRRTEPTPPEPVESDWILGPDRVLEIASEVAERASLYEGTGGAHAAALANRECIFSLVEDVSRTCALEKAIGEGLLRGIDFSHTLAFISSRVPARMIEKLGRCGVPIVAAVSAPTATAVGLAEALNVCLCGFVRGERMNVYTHGWRVEL